MPSFQTPAKLKLTGQQKYNLSDYMHIFISNFYLKTFIHVSGSCLDSEQKAREARTSGHETHKSG
jgi:hypothetical protein